MALVEAAKAAPDPEQAPAHKKAAPAIVTPEAAQEARRARDEHPTAA